MTSNSPIPALGEEAVKPVQHNLAGAFGAPDRSAGVPRLGRPVVATDPAIDVPAQQPARPPSQDQHIEAPTRNVTKTPRPAEPKVVYLLPVLRDRLKAESERSGRTYTQIVLDALNACHDDLDRITQKAVPPRRVEGLFEVQDSGRRHGLGYQVQVSIRPTTHNLAVIDRLAEHYTNENRSALIAAALEHYLK